MAYASIISSLVNVGFDIYGQLSKQSPQSIATQYSSSLRDNANRYIRPFTSKDYWKIDPTQMAQQSIQFGLNAAPAINQANMNQLQSMLNQAFPGYQSMFGTAASNAASLMSGNIPSDVQGLIQRNAAQTGFAGGYGSPMQKSMTARDLGLTSLQLQQTGTSQFGSLMQMASNYMMPQMVNPLSLLPVSDLINTAEWSKASAFQSNEAMYTALSNAAAAKAGAPATSPITGIGSAVAGGISALGQSPQGQSGGSGSIMSMIMGMFGGSGGSSGGGGGMGGFGSNIMQGMGG